MPHIIAATGLSFIATDTVRGFIGIVILAVLFWIVEAIWPEDRQLPRKRKGRFTDALYFFFVVPTAKSLATIGIVIAFVITIRLMPHGIGLVQIASQPLWLQGFEVIFVGDFLGYWSHRAFHKIPALWPYHAVHHSSENIDWMASARVHPIDTIISRLITTVPFFFIGIAQNVLAPYVVFLSLYPIYLHANVAWDYGPFRYLIASPAFHRWHHTAEQAGLDKNLAGLFPLFDAIFGTLYFPRRASTRYGLYNDRMSDNIFAQLAYPFRKRRPVAVPPRPTR
jgi:sterol desaturase/sphingolipid hydroxylase (fatty acid hydroxylase superfamily)